MFKFGCSRHSFNSARIFINFSLKSPLDRSQKGEPQPILFVISNTFNSLSQGVKPRSTRSTRCYSNALATRGLFANFGGRCIRVGSDDNFDYHSSVLN